MWKFSLICCFIAISTGIALNLISNSIQDKTKYLSQLENQINKKVEKLHILQTEWEFHTHPEKLMELANNKFTTLSSRWKYIMDGTRHAFINSKRRCRRTE